MKLLLMIGLLSTMKHTNGFVHSCGSAEKCTVLSAKECGRSDFFRYVGSVVGASVIATPNAANAAKYGGFGSASPNVLNPKDAIIDEDILKSEGVQNARNKIRAYLDGVRQMEKALKKNGQVDVGPFLRKEYDFVKLRDNLNIVNSAFDEDTQKGTDRLIRAILQDITELETANRQKENIPRSERRVEIMLSKLDKLALAFEQYLAFSS